MVSIVHRLRFIGFLLLFGLHGWLLVLRIPHTLIMLLRAFRSGGHGISNPDFWAFSRTNARYQAWYNKVARDYHTQGRFGFAWEDGLGMALGPRYYNSWVTYALLYRLGARRMMAFGYLCMIVAVTMLFVLLFEWWGGVAAGILIAGSPLYAISYTHRGKPEAFWWAMVPLVVFNAFVDPGLQTGLWWSFIAFVNLPLSMMLVLLAGPAVIVHALQQGCLLAVLLGTLPGILKHGLRCLPALRSRLFSTIVSDLTRTTHRRLCPSPVELVWCVPFGLSIAASGFASGKYLIAGLLLLVGWAIYYFNAHILTLNDYGSFHNAYFSVALGFAAAVGSPLAVVGLLLLAYNHPHVCKRDPPLREMPETDPLRWHLSNAWGTIKAFPDVTCVRLPQPEALMEFFKQLPNGARIMAESEGDPYTESLFVPFWVWTQDVLPDRQISLANEVYTRIAEPEFFQRYLISFRGGLLPPDQMKHICRQLGVSFVVAHTQETAETLQAIGCQVAGVVELEKLEDFRRIVACPPATLRLLRMPSPASVVDPPTPWERKGNTMRWNAKKGQTYQIRFRHHPSFCANQDDHSLAVEPYRPFEELRLTFMKVTATSDGPLSLQFVPSWF